MNTPIINSSDRVDTVDTNVIFTRLRELFPNTKKVEAVTVLAEFTELAYKDDEMDVKFEFIGPHTVKMIYHGNKYVNIDDEEFDIYLGNKTEEEAILDYICYLDFLWTEYIDDYNPDTMGKGLIERINTVKAKVKKL